MAGKLTSVSVLMIMGGLFSMLLGCSGGGGGLSPTAVIDEQSLSQALTDIQTTVPECISNAPIFHYNNVFRNKALPTKLPIGDVLTTFSIQGEGSYSGNCSGSPGSLVISQVSHENGVTELSVAFSGYCTQSFTGQKAIIDGNASYIEHGKPSDAGPIVSKQTGETDAKGLRLVRYGSDGITKTTDKTIVMKGYSLTYGTAYNYFLGRNPPTEQAPNAAKIKELVIKDNLNSIETKLVDISSTVFESQPGSELTNHVVTISGGGVRVGDSGLATVKTVENAPLIVDSDHNVTSGTVLMTGSSGTATFTVNGLNTATVEVNGAPLVAGTALDCSKFVFDDFFYGK